MVPYYETVGRTLSAANVQWSVMKNFDTQWKALKLKKNKDEPETPKITKGLNVMKWGESFRDYLHRCVGVRMVPLVYVIREEADVPAECPPNATGQPHSDSAGSVEEELVSRATQTHPLFRNDNASVYYKMEEATRGTSYAASIKNLIRGERMDAVLLWLSLHNMQEMINGIRKSQNRTPYCTLIDGVETVASLWNVTAVTIGMHLYK